MASDQVVSAKDVLHALMQVRRRGNNPVLRELEKQEPDLTEFLLEEVTAIHQDLLKLGGHARQARKLSSRIETMALVLVTSLRNAHLRLWR